MKTPEACYSISYCIEFAGEAHTVAESLIKPSAVEIATCVLGE
jgi:hypothetical protein